MWGRVCAPAHGYMRGGGYKRGSMNGCMRAMSGGHMWRGAVRGSEYERVCSRIRVLEY